MSKKNGSSVSPAKNEMPVAASVVTTGVAEVGEVAEDTVVGALNSMASVFFCPPIVICAICGCEREVCSSKLT